MSAAASSSSYDIVDAQVHLTKDLGREQILTSLDALGINAVLIDEYWGIDERWMAMPCDPLADGLHRPVSPTAQAMALAQPDRVSYLQRVERRDPLLAEVVALLGAAEGARAARLVLLNAEDRAGFGYGAFDQVFSLAVQHDLAVCVLGPDLSTLPHVVRRFPDLRLVLDHCGWARSAAHWDQVLGAASLPQVHLKWSHTSRAFGHVTGQDGDVAATTNEEFLRALDAYGVERVLWASDVTEEETSWANLLGFVTAHPSLSPGDKQWVLGRAARDVFRWPAPMEGT